MLPIIYPPRPPPPLLTLLGPGFPPQASWGKVYRRKLHCSKVATVAARGGRARSREVGSVGVVDVVVSTEAAAVEWPPAGVEVIFLVLMVLREAW